MALEPMPVVPVYENARTIVLKFGDKLLVRHTVLGFDPELPAAHWLQMEDEPPLTPPRR